MNNEVATVKRLGKDKYEVTTSNGTKYHSKHVLITFSSGVLLSGNVNFLPKLPAWKMESLNMVPMSHYCKIFLRFDKQFWDNFRYMMIATKFKGHYMHWQNYNHELYPGKNILVATLTGDICYENHLYTDAEIKKEIAKVLKKVFPGATESIGKNEVILFWTQE